MSVHAWLLLVRKWWHRWKYLIMAKESPKQQFLLPSGTLELQIIKMKCIKREAGGGCVGGIWELYWNNVENSNFLWELKI